MYTRKFPGSMTTRLVTLIGTGLVFMGCSSGSGTQSPDDASNGSGSSSGSGAGKAGAGGAGKAGAGGAGQAGSGGAGKAGSGGGGQGGSGGAGKAGSGGSGQAGSGGSGQTGLGGAGQTGSGGSGQAGSGGSIPNPSSGFHSPYAVAYSDDSATLAVTDSSTAALVVLDPKAGTSLRSVTLSGEPKGLAWSAAGKVMVAEYGAGTVAEVDTTAGSVIRRLDVGPKPTDVALTADHSKLVVPTSP
jgi:hypothetical protein